jgi:hypothetical protein
VVTVGPPQGIVIAKTGRIVVPAGGSAIQGGRVFLSDDAGVTWWASSLANAKVKVGGGSLFIALHGSDH